MRFLLTLLYSIILSFSSFSQQSSDCGKYKNNLKILKEHLPIEKVYVHTDQNYYEPGSVIWFKAYVTDASLRNSTISKQLKAELYDPLGNKISANLLMIKDGCANGDFSISSAAPGGIYTLKAYTNWQNNFGEELLFEKKLTVQRNVLPTVLMKLDFLKEKYGPGSEVSAKFEARSKDNKAIADQTIDFNLHLNGKKEISGKAQTDTEGKAIVIFKLPENLNTADGLLNITIDYNGRKESISRSVPIMTRKLVLNFMPEGGDLIEGFANRVALKALDEFGKPADIKGILFDNHGNKISEVESYHQGMGAFMLNPEKGKKYSLKITEPKGINTSYELPKSISTSATFSVDRQNQNYIELTVFSPRNQPLCLAAVMNDSIIYDLGIEAKKGENLIKIPSSYFPVGIAQITLFNAGGKPMAERLVFANKHKTLKIDIKTDKESYQTRDSVLLEITVKDENGNPVRGDFSLAVVDDKLWSFADDHQNNILSYLLMSSELKGEVYEPDFYFNPNEPKADSALDLVMLTHGWRRYKWKELLAADAEKKIIKSRKFDPEPETAIKGKLTREGIPMANTAIHIRSLNGKKCLEGPTIVFTDKEGNFSIADVSCPVQLSVNHRGFISKTTVYPRNTVYSQRNSDQYTGTALKVQKYTTKDDGSNGNLKGKITDENAEPVAFANLLLYQGELLVKATSSDFDGNYNFGMINPGRYDILLKYTGYPDKRIQNILVLNGRIQTYDLTYEEEDAAQLSEVIVTQERVPVIEVDNVTAVQTLGNREIKRMAPRDIRSVSTTTPGVTQIDRGEAIRSNRSRNLERAVKLSPQIKDSDIQIIRGVSSEVLFADAQRALPPAAQLAERQALRAVSPTIPAELGDEIEMRRLRGEMFNVGGNDPIQSNITSVSGKFVQPVISITQNGAPNFYNARIFYAPDYTQYLKARNKKLADNERNDFRKTVYWQPYVKTDASGKAKILFYNSDDCSTFRIITEGIGGSSVGRAEKTYAVKLPFEIDAKIPPVMTFGDTLILPLVLKNNTEKTIEGNLKISENYGLKALNLPDMDKIKIPAGSFVKVDLPFEVLDIPGRQSIILKFESEGAEDELTLSYTAINKGFPVELGFSGKEMENNVVFDLGSPIEGSIRAEFKISGNILEDLKGSFEAMLRQPSGCFEQVSSSNYPNILALQFMKTTNELKPDVYDRALGFLDIGYKKLAGYESAGGGFEWFGKSPAHEGLTAFGLMEFKDMKEVYQGIDVAMIKRAKDWLLSRRDGNGGFLSASGYNHGWGNSKAVYNAYITYALAYIGEKNISKEIKSISNEAKKSSDLYRLGLAVLANQEFGNIKVADELLKMLNDQIKKAGPDNVKAEHSITYSSGIALKTEILGIAILANLSSENPDTGTIGTYIESILKTRRYGYFGNTQATVWALKALCDYAVFIGQKTEEGEVLLYINGTLAAKSPVSQKNSKNIVFGNLEKYLKAKDNEIKIKFEGMKEGLPYSFNANWSTLTPQSSESCPLKLKTVLNSSVVNTGETVRMTAVISNTDTKDAPTPMAVIGIPSGLSLQPWQLKELLEMEKVDFYEISNNLLILYYRSIKAGETKTVQLDLKADIPGTYRASAGRTYMYYGAEFKNWEEGNTVRIIN